MDNVSYHSIKDKAPTSTIQKADIMKWLEDKSKVIDITMVISELLEIVKQIKLLYDKFVIDKNSPKPII